MTSNLHDIRSIQVFTWNDGTIVAGGANVFSLDEYDSSNTKTRTMQFTGSPDSFDTAGFAQSIPAFTGMGKLRLTGARGIITPKRLAMPSARK